MIKRSGFVSNSSSSSFIVNFPKRPDNKLEFQKFMGYGLTEDILNRVWMDIQPAMLKTDEELKLINHPGIFLEDDENLQDDSYRLIQKLESLVDDIVFEIPWDDRKYGYAELQVLEKLVDRIQSRIQRVQKQAEENPKTTFTVRLTYSDECGEGWLEHGNIFRNVDHTVISHH